MRLIKTNISALIMILGMLACQTEDPLEQFGITKPVVESFISAEADTVMINITEMIPYLNEEGDTVANPLTGLSVFLIKEDEHFLLTEQSGETGKYYILSKTINLTEGDSLSFESEVGDLLISASTWIPTKPASVKTSDEAMYYEVGNPMSMMNAPSLIVSWDNPKNGFYYVSMINIESDPEPVNENIENAPARSEAPPSQADQFEIRLRNIRHFGTHQVILYHVNQEFANLFDNPTMNSVNISEPPTNIENGLGIFSGISADTVYFEVKKQ